MVMKHRSEDHLPRTKSGMQVQTVEKTGISFLGETSLLDSPPLGNGSLTNDKTDFHSENKASPVLKTHIVDKC